MGLYVFLDLMVTVSEQVVFCELLGIFGRKSRLPEAAARIVPSVIYLSGVMFLTWFTDLGAVKVFLLLPLGFACVRLCYEISFFENLFLLELFWLLAVLLPDAVGNALAYVIYQGEITAVIEGVLVMKWLAYVINILVRFVFLGIAHRLLRSFPYPVCLEDAAFLTPGFLLSFGVSFASSYGYLNLKMTDTLILDLAAALLCVSFVIQIFYSKNVSYLREQERLDKMQIVQLRKQYSYYREKLKDEERVRGLYHDMKNHLLVLEHQAASPGTAEMVEKLQMEMAAYEDYIHTGSDILDIILKEKGEIAREKQIAFSVAAHMEGMDFIEPLDISTIFGNGLDNALEASEKLSEDQRVILVKAGKVREFFSILIENNCLEEDGASGMRTAKEDGFLHGFGIPNMEKAAGKYGGQLTVKCEKGKFTLKILIPVPREMGT